MVNSKRIQQSGKDETQGRKWKLLNYLFKAELVPFRRAEETPGKYR